MVLVVRDLALQQPIAPGFTIVRKVPAMTEMNVVRKANERTDGRTLGQEIHQQMNEFRVFLLHRFPAEIDDRLEAQALVMLLPTISDQDGVRIREGSELELCSSYVGLTWPETMMTIGVVLTRDRSELVRLENLVHNRFPIGIILPFQDVTMDDNSGSQYVPTPALPFVGKELT